MQRIRELIRVLRRDQQPGRTVLDDFGNPADATGDDGQPRGHRLDGYQPERFQPRHMRENVERAEPAMRV